MSDRVTIKDLEAICSRINREVNGRDDVPLWRRVAGGAVQSPDVFYIDQAYGGCALYRACSEGADGQSHGVSDVLRVGHRPKRELRDLMFAFLEGYELASR